MNSRGLDAPADASYDVPDLDDVIDAAAVEAIGHWGFDPERWPGESARFAFLVEYLRDAEAVEADHVAATGCHGWESTLANAAVVAAREAVASSDQDASRLGAEVLEAMGLEVHAEHLDLWGDDGRVAAEEE